MQSGRQSGRQRGWVKWVKWVILPLRRSGGCVFIKRNTRMPGPDNARREYRWAGFNPSDPPNPLERTFCTSGTSALRYCAGCRVSGVGLSGVGLSRCRVSGCRVACYSIVWYLFPRSCYAHMDCFYGAYPPQGIREAFQVAIGLVGLLPGVYGRCDFRSCDSVCAYLARIWCNPVVNMNGLDPL